MNASSQQDKILAARVSDAVSTAQLRHQTKFIGFLGEHEAAFAAGVARSLHHDALRLYGGHENAARVFLGVFSQYDEPNDAGFPISPVTFLYRKADSLTHRDFLGALMNLMVTRESIGDILVGEGCAVAFLSENAAALALNELGKVGSVGVEVSRGICVPLPCEQRFEVISGVVASERLDCIMALIAAQSREKAARLIVSGVVGINGRITDNISFRLAAGDTISVRGLGRFVYDGISAATRKGRACVSVRKYI